MMMANMTKKIRPIFFRTNFFWPIGKYDNDIADDQGVPLVLFPGDSTMVTNMTTVTMMTLMAIMKMMLMTLMVLIMWM